ncbi:tyrosine-type recombinase/integrase [Mesorhizobium australicum]|uniref:tyrosine-type recombinase/integrase n=1 Tax=Mesorhizobium australicum TaxID=536018 RepID=UPI00333C3B15
MAGSNSGGSQVRISCATAFATQLVRQRRPINEVADLLGHRSINTTALYVKVAASQLAEVALPFPGGAA